MMCQKMSFPLPLAPLISCSQTLLAAHAPTIAGQGQLLHQVDEVAHLLLGLSL